MTDRQKSEYCNPLARALRVNKIIIIAWLIYLMDDSEISNAWFEV